MEKNQKKKIEKNGKDNKKLIIAIVILLLIIVIGISIFFIIKNNRGGVKTQNMGDEAIDNGPPQEEYSLIDMENSENVEIKDGIKENNSEELKKDKTFEGMKVSEIKLQAGQQEGLTDFTAKVENTSGKDFAGGEIVIIFTNRDGSEYARLNGYLPDISAGDSNMIDASTTTDVSNAYDFTIERSK